MEIKKHHLIIVSVSQLVFTLLQKLKKKDGKLVDRLLPSHDRSSSNVSINSVGSGDSFNFDDSLADSSLKKSLSDLELNSLSEQEFLDSGAPDTQSLNEVDNLTIRISPEKVINLPHLTEAQVKAITGKFVYYGQFSCCINPYA